MVVEKDQFKKLNTALKALDKNTFLIPDNIKVNKILEECIDIIKQNNYAVIKQPKGASKVNSTKDLVDLYYYLLQFNFGDKIIPCRRDSIDFSIAKKMINKIQIGSNLNYKGAIKQCVSIVGGLFKYHKELNLHPQTFTSFRLFGQDKLGWITERIIGFLNDEKYNESDWISRVDRWAETQAVNNNIEFGIPDLEELANKIKEQKNAKKNN